MGEDYVVIWPGDYGLTWYGDVLFTTDQMIEEHPDVVEGFVRASLHGWQTAIENTDLALKATLAYDEELDEDFQRAAMQAGIPLIDTGEGSLGVMDQSVWESTQQVLRDQNLIQSTVEVNKLYTNTFAEKAN
jgi:NitT/TauT family transport system substrate-binding protein